MYPLLSTRHMGPHAIVWQQSPTTYQLLSTTGSTIKKVANWTRACQTMVSYTSRPAPKLHGDRSQCWLDPTTAPGTSLAWHLPTMDWFHHPEMGGYTRSIPLTGKSWPRVHWTTMSHSHSTESLDTSNEPLEAPSASYTWHQQASSATSPGYSPPSTRHVQVNWESS